MEMLQLPPPLFLWQPLCPVKRVLGKIPANSSYTQGWKEEQPTVGSGLNSEESSC